MTQSQSRGTNMPRVADFNEAVVLNAIRRAPGGRSRVELTEESGLSAQTVSNICRRLLDQQLIVETGKQAVAFGKPRTMLDLNPSGCYAIGVHIDPAVITYVLLDFTGRVVVDASHATPAVQDPDSVLAQINEQIASLIAAAPIERDRILGIGIASPGPVDVTRGLVLDPPHLPDWHQVPLRDNIHEATGLPVLLDKDVIAGAVAEQWAGGTDGPRNFVFLYLGTGVGLGIVIDDIVVRGISSNAGDVGLLPVSADEFGDRYTQPFRAFWQAGSPQSLAAEGVAAGVLPPDTDLSTPATAEAAFHDLCARADAGDAGAIEILDRAARSTASAILTVANLLDVDAIIIGGAMWEHLSERFLRIIRPIVTEGAIARQLHEVTITGTALGADVAAIGAACLVLDNKFSPRPATLQLGR
ncbi:MULTISPECIES: ROK family transcriptional regulator [unclassified Microbacterium]|uniref:ROK family transcriptional regulator n=1 Tax=unclassified Microbacterium TaxID=2609290 RepID=UPI0030102849